MKEYTVGINFIFNGVVKVKAKSAEEARQIIHKMQAKITDVYFDETKVIDWEIDPKANAKANNEK